MYMSYFWYASVWGRLRSQLLYLITFANDKLAKVLIINALWVRKALFFFLKDLPG